MQKNILAEINRVREIMGVSILNEQDNRQSIGDPIIIGTSEGFDAGEPIEMHLTKDAQFAVMQDSSSSVNEDFYSAMKDKFEETFPNWESMKDQIVLTKAKIRSGASNFYNSNPTLADLKNNRETPLPSQGGQRKGGVELMSTAKGFIYDTDYYWDNDRYIPAEKGMPGGEAYDANKDLARRRGVNFLSFIKNKMREDGMDYLEPLQEEEINSFIIDTGGVIDKRRDTSLFPNPGQFISMELSFEKLGGKEPGEDIMGCLVNLELSVGYYTKTGQGHNCDAAIFDIFMNKEKIGTANLNNLDDPNHGPFKASKASRVGDGGEYGKNRRCEFIINNELAQRIMKDSGDDATIEIGIEGMIKGGCKGKNGGIHDTNNPNYDGNQWIESNGRPRVWRRLDNGGIVKGDKNKKEGIEYELVSDNIKKGAKCSVAKYQGANTRDHKNRALHASVPFVTIKDGNGKEFYSGLPDVNMLRGDESYKKIIIMDVCKQTVNDSL